MIGRCHRIIDVRQHYIHYYYYDLQPYRYLKLLHLPIYNEGAFPRIDILVPIPRSNTVVRYCGYRNDRTAGTVYAFIVLRFEHAVTRWRVVPDPGVVAHGRNVVGASFVPRVTVITANWTQADKTAHVCACIS